LSSVNQNSLAIIEVNIYSCPFDDSLISPYQIN